MSSGSRRRSCSSRRWRSGLLAVTGHLTFEWLLALSLFGGALAAFEIPARQSLIVELVGKEDLPQAIGLNSTGFNLARVLGPSVAAIVIAQGGIAWTFGLNALSYLAVLIGLGMIRLPERRATSRHTGSPLERDARGAALRARHAAPADAAHPRDGVCDPRRAGDHACSRWSRATCSDSVPDGYGVLMASFGFGAVVGALGIAATGGGPARGMAVPHRLAIAAAPPHRLLPRARALALRLCSSSAWASR